MGEKKIFSTRVDGDRIKDLKHLAVDTDRSLGNLLEEAIQDLVKKYEQKPKKFTLSERAMDLISRPHFSDREMGFCSL